LLPSVEGDLPFLWLGELDYWNPQVLHDLYLERLAEREMPLRLLACRNGERSSFSKE
jgi:hypothetical protein